MTSGLELTYAKSKLITSYETKFIRFILENYALRMEPPPAPIGDLSDYHGGVMRGALERAIEGRNKPRPKSKRTNNEEIALENAVADMYDLFLKQETLQKTHRTWQELFTDAFKGRDDYLGYMKKISEAYANVCSKHSPLKPSQSLGKVIYGVAEGLAGEVWKESQIQPLSNRYDISYTFFIHDGNEYKPTGKTGQLNTALNRLIEERVLGREESKGVFKNLQPLFADDRTVSRRHFYLEENDDGLTLCVISSNETTVINYMGNTTSLKSPDSKNRVPVAALLVPIGVEGDNIDCGAVFGGDNEKKYQLKITLTKRIQA